jgi:hypothetical protein
LGDERARRGTAGVQLVSDGHEVVKLTELDRAVEEARFPITSLDAPCNDLASSGSGESGAAERCLNSATSARCAVINGRYQQPNDSYWTGQSSDDFIRRAPDHARHLSRWIPT